MQPNRVQATISRGEKTRLTSEDIEAAKKIMDREGVNNPGVAEHHPNIFGAWTSLIDDLSAGHIGDAKAMQKRLDELLFPDALEDLEDDKEIMRLFKEHLERHPGKRT